MSDGCTNTPDLDVRHCCVDHDNLYAEGKLSRFMCDYIFFKCIVQKSTGFFSRIKYNFIGLYYWAGVRLFGSKYYNK